MFSPAVTEASRNQAACGVRVPRDTRSSRLLAATTNLRMLRERCSRVMSGMTACGREPSGEQGVHERAGEVEPAPGRFEHPLHEVPDLARGASTVVVSSERPCRAMKTPPGFVDPDLLDVAILQVALQRPEAGQCIEDESGGARPVDQRRQRRVRYPLLVVGDDLVDQQPGRPLVGDRVDAPAPDQLAHLIVDVLGCCRHPYPRSAGRVTVPRRREPAPHPSTSGGPAARSPVPAPYRVESRRHSLTSANDRSTKLRPQWVLVCPSGGRPPCCPPSWGRRSDRTLSPVLRRVLNVPLDGDQRGRERLRGC